MHDTSSQAEIQATLLRLASPNIKPKELLKQVRNVHRDASRREIVRAAFASMIAIVDTDAQKALQLQDFALRERSQGEDAPNA